MGDEDTMSDYRYWGNCSDSTAEDIWALQESAKPVSWRTFKKAIPDARQMLVDAGAISEDITDKEIEDSWFLDFFRSEHRGRPAYFISWSGIEWIWERVDWDWDANPPQPVFTPEQDREIVLQHALGMTIKELAALYGVSSSTIRKAVKREGGAVVKHSRPRPRKRALSPAQEQEIVEAYRSGMDDREVAEVFDVSVSTIANVRKRHDVPSHRSTPLLSRKNDLEIKGAYDAGLSTEALAEAYGVSPTAIINSLKRAGTERRTKGAYASSTKGILRTQQHKIPSQDIPLVARLYRGLVPSREIAEMWGVSKSTVLRTLDRYGYQKRPKHLSRGYRGHLITGLEPQIVEDYLGGMTERQLIEKYAITPREIAEAVDRHLGAPVRKAENPLRPSVSGALGIASLSFLLIGLGFAIRAARMRKRRDPGPGRTAAVGNSITASTNGFVSFLDRSLPQRSFANMGVVGEGAAAIARRLERNVIGHGYDEVIIEAGINDINRQDAVEYIPRQLASMVRSAKAAGLKVVLTTLPPWQDQATRILAVNQRIKDEGRSWGADVIVDIHRPLADWRGGLRSELIGDRMGLHPTQAGQELIGRAILESAYS